VKRVNVDGENWELDNDKGKKMVVTKKGWEFAKTKGEDDVSYNWL
jgi:hypothetical protein